MKKSSFKEEEFTLIELIVVIGIIAVLTGMLLPTLKQVMDKAKSISCVSNLKQSGIAIALYKQDFDDWFFNVNGITTAVYNHPLAQKLKTCGYLTTFKSMRCTATRVIGEPDSANITPVDLESARGSYRTYGYDNGGPTHTRNRQFYKFYWKTGPIQYFPPDSHKFLIGCSLENPENPAQIAPINLILTQSSTAYGRLHMVHSGHANGAMNDGSVAQITVIDLAAKNYCFMSAVYINTNPLRPIVTAYRAGKIINYYP